MAKYILIYDTGDSVFETQKEAFRYAKDLKKRGHKLDRLQVYRFMLEKVIKQNPE